MRRAPPRQPPQLSSLALQVTCVVFQLRPLLCSLSPVLVCLFPLHPHEAALHCGVRLCPLLWDGCLNTRKLFSKHRVHPGLKCPLLSLQILGLQTRPFQLIRSQLSSCLEWFNVSNRQCQQGLPLGVGCVAELRGHQEPEKGWGGVQGAWGCTRIHLPLEAMSEHPSTWSPQFGAADNDNMKDGRNRLNDP